MATTIIHKKSSVASSIPVAGDLEPGEIAVNLADKKLYSKTTGGTVIELAPNDDQTAAQLLTAIKTVDGSGSGLDADLLDGINSGSFLRSDVSDTVTNSTVTFDSSSRLTGSDAILDGFAMPQNPEGKHIKSPFFFNDIAYSRLRGATISVDVDGVAMTSTTYIDNMLNASGDVWNLYTAGKTTATITITNSPKALTWGSHMGLSFGNSNWRAKNITLEYSADNGTTWTLVKSLTNQPEEFVSGYWGMGSGVSASAFRWTLSNFNTSAMRISSLFAYNYNSGGMKDLYVTRDGGSIYGNLAITGTVDGRDVATDGTKLDGIEAGAKADQVGLVKGADIGAGADLNTYTTNGYFHQNGNSNASSGTNYPVALAGMLSVQADGSMVYQKYQTYNGDGTYQRTKYNGSWFPWDKILDTGNAFIFTSADNTKLDGIASGATNTAAPAISSNGSTPSLASGITAAEVRSLIGAGTSSSDNTTHTGEVTGSGALTIAADVVDAGNLKVTGNGTSTQFLRSDGDGSFTWATPTDTNTTYSVGDGGLTQKNFTTTLNTKLDGISTGATNTDADYDTSTSSTGYFQASVGTTAQRPTAAVGMMRYNTTRGCFEGYTASGWVNLSPETIDGVGDIV